MKKQKFVVEAAFALLVKHCRHQEGGNSISNSVVAQNPHPLEKN